MNTIQRFATAVLLATGITFAPQEKIREIAQGDTQKINDVFAATEVDSNPGDIKVTMENIIKMRNHAHKINESTIIGVGSNGEKVALTKISPEHFTLTIDDVPYQITYDNTEENRAYDFPATVSQEDIGAIDIYLYDIMSQIGLFRNGQTLWDIYGERSFQIAIDNELPIYYISQEDRHTKIYLNTLEEVDEARSNGDIVIVLVKPGTVIPFK